MVGIEVVVVVVFCTVGGMVVLWLIVVIGCEVVTGIVVATDVVV